MFVMYNSYRGKVGGSQSGENSENGRRQYTQTPPLESKTRYPPFVRYPPPGYRVLLDSLDLPVIVDEVLGAPAETVSHQAFRHVHTVHILQQVSVRNYIF